VLQDTLRRTRQEAVEQALEQADGNVAAAAAELGILRTSLYRLMKRFGITPPTRAGD
jgi:transcriptional regulator of acetoin/glycerol metabolism